MEANLRMIQMQQANLAAIEKGKKGHSKKRENTLASMLGGAAPNPQPLASTGQHTGTAAQIKEQERSLYNGMPSSGPSSPSRKAGGGLQRLGSTDSPETSQKSINTPAKDSITVKKRGGHSPSNQK